MPFAVGVTASVAIAAAFLTIMFSSALKLETGTAALGPQGGSGTESTEIV